MPIFQSSCGLTESCHGDPSVVSESRPFLGYSNPDGGASFLQMVLAGIVGVKSTEDLSMNLITPGDPAQSFLMHKMDDDQCTLITECMVGHSFRPNCGVFMPYQFPDVLDADARDTVRRWIKQGAQDN